MDTLTQNQIKFNNQQLNLKYKECIKSNLEIGENIAYQKIITKESPANLICIMENSRLFARPVRSILHVFELFFIVVVKIDLKHYVVVKMPDKTIQHLSGRLKTQDYSLLIKRLDQSSITVNLKNGSNEASDLIQILKVNLFYLYSRNLQFFFVNRIWKYLDLFLNKILALFNLKKGRNIWFDLIHLKIAEICSQILCLRF